MSENKNKLGKHSRTFGLNVTTKVVQVVASDPHRTGLLIYNNGSATVYVLSAQNMKVSDGIPVAAGVPYTNDTTTAALYIRSASGTQNVRVQVDGD